MYINTIIKTVTQSTVYTYVDNTRCGTIQCKYDMDRRKAV